MILLEHAETLLLGLYHITCSGFEFSAEDSEKRRLSCSVRADNSVAVTICEFEIYIFEQRCSAKLYTNI